MKNMSKMAVKVAGTGALAILLTASAFADSRPQDGSWRNNRGESRGDNRGDNRDNRGYNNENDSRRHDNRISESGKIRSFKQERDGYRVYLDRGNYSYWVPQSHLRGHRLSVAARGERCQPIREIRFTFPDSDRIGFDGATEPDQLNRADCGEGSRRDARAEKAVGRGDLREAG